MKKRLMFPCGFLSLACALMLVLGACQSENADAPAVQQGPPQEVQLAEHDIDLSAQLSPEELRGWKSTMAFPSSPPRAAKRY